MKKLFNGFMIVVFLVIATALLFNFNGNAFSFETSELNKEQVIDAEKIKKIEVESSSTDVLIKPTNSDEILVKLSGEVSNKLKSSFVLEVDEDNDSVRIKVERKERSFFQSFISISKVKLEVYVPQNQYEEIVMETSSGDVQYKEVEVKQLNIQTSSGDIDVEEMSEVEALSLQASSGDISLSGIATQKLEVTTSSGDIFSNGDLSYENATIEANSGDIELENVEGDLSVKTSSGDIELRDNELKENVKLETSSGDVNVFFRTQPDSLKLHFKASSGDGSVSLDGLQYTEKSEHNIVGGLGEEEYQIDVKTSSGDFTLN
ncbi:DUF4097 domain-containing protein [Bacillus carboniphilus]|uniref:DUF4097 domain-containing protein n=1 Tax=Bacillus carboniphilus TaxID=86663 RepID=A0ABP3FRD2_9BACI